MSSFDKWSTSKKKDDDLGYTPWWKRKTEKKYTSRLGFDPYDYKSSYTYYGYGKSSYYSSYDAAGDKELNDEILDILKVAYNNSRDLVNILEFPFRINIYYDSNAITRNEKFHLATTRERSIYINTISYLGELIKNKSDLTEENKEKCIQVVSGNSLHEASHLKFTNLIPVINFFGSPNIFDTIVVPNSTKALNDLGKRINIVTHSSFFDVLKSLTYSLFSYLEDERVDSFLVEERNGWYEYLTNYKDYCYNYLYKKNAKRGKNYLTHISLVPEDRVDFVEFLTILVKFIRFREYLTDKEILKYETLLNKAQEYISPKSTIDSCGNSLLLVENIITSAINLHNQPLSIANEQIRDDKVSKRITNLGILDEDTIISIRKFLKFSSIVSNVYQGNEEGVQSLLERNKDIRDLLFIDIDSSPALRSIPKSGLDIVTGEISGDYKKGVYFYKPIGDEKSYNEIQKKISPYIPIMKNMVRNVNKNFDFTIYGQRNGKLDTTKLAEAYQGVPQVYVKQGITRTTGINVCVVVDESGSMCYKSRYLRAREAGILLNEAFGFTSGVNLFLYGHTADKLYYGSTGSTDIYIYREPGLSSLGRPGTGCSSISAKRENRDGLALKSIAERVRTFTSQPVLMFVISDGEPSADGYRGESAIRDTREKVKEIEAMGFHIIQVTISGEDVDASKMFRNFVDLTNDISELPQVLSGIVRDQIVKILQSNQSTTTI